MYKFLLLCFAIPFLTAAVFSEPQTTKRIAILISSNGTENPELSYDLEELAQAYLVMYDHEIAIEIVSPAGGPVLVKTNKDELAYMQRFKRDTPAPKQLAATIAAKDADITSFDGLFIVGGGGAMIDLPSDPGVHKLLTLMVASGKPIAAVCHGPAALVDIKNPDGSYFVSGKSICSFTNIEEQAFSSEQLSAFPFLIEDKMREREANYKHNAPMLPYVAVDGNLITAQNPASVPQAAEALLVKLGLRLKQRQLFKDEATMALIARARVSGPFQIDLAMSHSPADYDLQYLGLYAFYSYRLAAKGDAKRTELGIMQAAARYFKHPMLQDALIRAQHEQGFASKAAANLAQLQKEHPEHAGLAELKALVIAK